MAEQTIPRALNGDRSRPGPGRKLEMLAQGQREVLRAEGRAQRAAEATPDDGFHRRRLEALFRVPQNTQREDDREQLSYNARALRGDLGEHEKQRAVDAYNRGEQIDGPPVTLTESASSVGTQPPEERAQSADQQTLEQKAALTGAPPTEAPGAKPVEVVASAPVSGVEKPAKK